MKAKKYQALKGCGVQFPLGFEALGFAPGGSDYKVILGLDISSDGSAKQEKGSEV